MTFRDTLLDWLAPSARDNGHQVKGVTVYGDSIAFSLNLTERFKALMPHIAVVDRSMPGDTARNAWRRFPYDNRSTNVVVLQVGTNDLGIDRDPMPALRKMARYALDEGRLVVFTGITWRVGLFPIAETNERIFELAEDYGCPCANWQAIPLIAADGLHPDPEMLDTMADQLSLTLQTIKGLA